MRSTLALLVAMALAGCGQKSDEDQLREAANQSDPAAAQVLNSAAENGMDPQEALEQAGQAAAASNAATNQGDTRMQARPNSAQNPNPVQPGQPPEKVATNEQ